MDERSGRAGELLGGVMAYVHRRTEPSGLISFQQGKRAGRRLASCLDRHLKTAKVDRSTFARLQHERWASLVPHSSPLLADLRPHHRRPLDDHLPDSLG
jgi:hypothetical protein